MAANFVGMLTKYILTIGSTEHEIPDECLKNWDEISFSLKRTDYSGVMRSFSTKFIFVGDIKDLLWDLYLTYGFLASASVADADSYFWQLVEFKGALQYSIATQSVSIYVPELDLYPELRTGKVTAAACWLTLKVKKDGETYTDTAVVFIKRE